MKQTEDLNQKELLVRLDERVIQIQRDLDFLKKTAIPSNEHAQLMSSINAYDTRLDNLEKFNTKFLAYLGVASTLGGVVASLILSLLKDALGNVIKL